MKLRPHKLHALKTWPEYFKAVRAGLKTFEIRRNDRDFQVGDLLVLEEFDPNTNTYTEEKATVKITYMTPSDCLFLPENLVVMSFVPMGFAPKDIQ